MVSLMKDLMALVTLTAFGGVFLFYLDALTVF